MANLIFGFHHISPHEMSNVCLFDLSHCSEEYNDRLTGGAKGKESVRRGREEADRAKKPLLDSFCILGEERLLKLELCDLSATDRSPFGEINKPKINR